MADSQKNVVVEAVGLKKVFTDFWGRPKAIAVNGVDFTVNQGDAIGLLGPNGSGKSTTVKMILGLLYPTQGSLKVLGRAPTDVQTNMRIGYLPEETYLYKYLTAEETLDFFGALFNMGQEERRRRAEQLLEMVGLSHAAKRAVGEFSKGMARRIGLAQALINDPDLIILDEPTSGLDPIGVGEVKRLVKLLSSRGKTVILCSHLLSDVEDVCDKIMVMYGGKIRASGDLNKLLTVENQTRILAPALSPEVVERVLKVLDEAGAVGAQVDRPTMDLEEFFMNVVQEARKESKDNAGAVAGGEVAAYLKGKDPKGSNALLEELAKVESASEPVEEEPLAERRPDVERLSALSGPDREKQDAVAEQAGASELTEGEKEDVSSRIKDILSHR